MVTRAEVVELVREALSHRDECSSDTPHEGGLRYIREGKGRYVCRCGKRYVKGEGGVLRDDIVSNR